MRRWALGVVLLSAPATGAAERPREVEVALSDPAVSAVALMPYRADCKPCIAALPSWRRVHAERRKDGLRVLAWIEDGSGRCVAPPMKVDGVVCDPRGSLRRAEGLASEQDALAYGFDRPEPLAAGPAPDVQRAIGEWLQRRPRLRFEVEGDRGFIDAFRDALAGLTRVRGREGAVGAMAEGEPCGGGQLPADLWLRVEQSPAGADIKLAPAGGACLLNRAAFDYDPRRARASAARVMRELLPPWPLAPAGQASPPEAPPSVPQPARASASSADRSEAESSLAAGLRAFAGRWKGVRHRLGADGVGGSGIDGPHFVDRAYQEVLGLSLGSTLNELYRYPGETIELEPSTAEARLRPGDLVFLTTHADEPRQVMVYLGGGEVAQSIEVRGVVIEPLPRNLPDMFWIVGRRPHGAGRD